MLLLPFNPVTGSLRRSPELVGTAHITLHDSLIPPIHESHDLSDRVTGAPGCLNSHNLTVCLPASAPAVLATLTPLLPPPQL